MSRICPICGGECREPSAISITDNMTEICSSCGIREAVCDLMKPENLEQIIRKNKEMYI